ncbi:MAG: DUF1428 domain-containing protein [Paracoccaceae bacterium]
MDYVDGMLAAVPADARDAYLEHAARAAEIFRAHGALSVVECWGDDLPEGKRNSMHSAVLREPGETVVLSWVTWPSRAARDAGWEKVMADPRMSPEANPMPFDGSRMIFGGFEKIMEN